MAEDNFSGKSFYGTGRRGNWTERRKKELDDEEEARKFSAESLKKQAAKSAQADESLVDKAKNVVKGGAKIAGEIASSVTSNVRQNVVGGTELLKETTGLNKKEEETRRNVARAYEDALKKLRQDPEKNKAKIDDLVNQQRKFFEDTSKDAQADIKKLDPVKNAAAAAGTFVDAVTLGGGSAATQAGKTGLKVTAGKVAQNAAEGTLGGVLDAYSSKGKDTTLKEVGTGAAAGALVGGAIPLVGDIFGKARQAITGAGTTKVAKEAAVKEAERVARLAPEDYAKEFSVPVEEAKTQLKDIMAGRTSIAETGVRAKVRNIFNPVANLGEDTQKAFKKNAGGRNVAEQRARVVRTQLKEAAEASDTPLNLDLARQIEDGTAPDNAFTREFRQIADRTRQEANDAGLDIGYKENYVPHIWEKSPEEVDKIARGAGQKARAEGERVIPTYDEGIALGLKPKYKDPADMMADYVKNLENTRTNVALLTDLRDQGLVKSGRPPSGWKTITAEGFPRTAEGNMLAAPKQVADVLNNLYGNSDSIIDKALRKTAGFNSKWQDIALAGGIPKTPANFFTFSQMMKEGALGIGQTVTGSPIKGAKTIYSPVAAFARSFSDKSTRSFEKANSGFIESLAKRGVPISFSDGNEKAWSKLFNEPTFGRFMPMMQVNTAKNVFNAAAKKMPKGEAMDLAAETMKKMYGITDQLATGRSQAVQDMIGSVGFAPKYRESIMNVLGNTVKSLSPHTYGDKAYSLNRRLAVGLGATYAIYDQINRQTTGHSIMDNPEGKELQLAIPYGKKDDKGNQNVIYIPFMPSFMTLPRSAVAATQAALKGDLAGVTAEAGKFASMPLQVGSQILGNKDYFGRPIAMDAAASEATGDPEESVARQWGSRALYLLGQSSPALVRAGLGAAQGKPAEQNIAQATEAPVRFGKLSGRSNDKESFSTSQVTGDFFDIYRPAKASQTKASSEITDLIKEGRINEAKRRANEYNDTLQGKFEKYYKKYGKNPSDDKMWDEMLSGLFIKTNDRAFKARAKQD